MSELSRRIDRLAEAIDETVEMPELSLEETAAVAATIAGMRDGTVLDSNRAGIALKASLIKLANPSKEAKRLLLEFGIC